MNWGNAFSNAPLGLVPEFLRPAPAPVEASPPREDARLPEASPPGETVDASAAAPAPVETPEPARDGGGTAWRNRWRDCLTGSCRRLRRCRWRSEDCIERVNRDYDPEAMADLQRRLKWSLGAGPKPPDEPAAAPPAPPKRRRSGARRRARLPAMRGGTLTAPPASV